MYQHCLLKSNQVQDAGVDGVMHIKRLLVLVM